MKLAKGSGVNYILVNLWPILLATAVGLAVSAAYGAASVPGGLRSGVPRAGLVAVAVVAEFWLASILAGALILAPPQADPWIMALGSAVVIWIGFIVPVLAVNHPFRGLSFGAAARDAAHWLAVMLVQAAVLHAVGVVRVN